MDMTTIGTPTLWAGFTAFILIMLLLDLVVFHRKVHEVSLREALGWTVFWITLALIFNMGVWHWFGSERALEFLTGYLIEKALSVDNLFIFLVIFSYFSVPNDLQHRVLFLGILGALIMRVVFIGVGAVLLQKFHWVIYPFGALLVWTGIKLLIQRSSEVHPEKNFLVRLFKRFVPMTTDYRGTAFIVAESGRRFATPLLLVLVTIEVTDLIFAVDSIPAIFAVTSDPFIVYTSNIFAILGLRALYFALSGVMEKFHYLRVGLALVLAFVGTKMLISGMFKIPIAISLGVVVILLGLAIAASLLFPKAKPPLPVHPSHPTKD